MEIIGLEKGEAVTGATFTASARVNRVEHSRLKWPVARGLIKETHHAAIRSSGGGNSDVERETERSTASRSNAACLHSGMRLNRPQELTVEMGTPKWDATAVMPPKRITI